MNPYRPPHSSESTLPGFARDVLASCPKAGEGVNLWLFRCARRLHAYRTPAEIEALLAAAAANCGRSVTGHEIGRAVANSQQCAWHPGEAGPEKKGRKWPERNLEQIEAIISGKFGLVDLFENSPIRYDDNARHTEEVIDLLFPGNPLLCVAKANCDFRTQAREELRGSLSDMTLIVPSPMTSRTGRTKEGKISAHTLDNTGARRFLVIECDFRADEPWVRAAVQRGTDISDICAAILSDLATRVPFALGVHSGGKSLHGWFACADQPEERIKKFMRYAVSIGADEATWTRSQFVRMPDGTRDNGKRQTIYYFNPRVLT